MALSANREKCANAHLFKEIARNAGGRLLAMATSPESRPDGSGWRKRGIPLRGKQ
jgi:hypothetical protein